MCYGESSFLVHTEFYVHTYTTTLHCHSVNLFCMSKI